MIMLQAPNHPCWSIFPELAQFWEIKNNMLSGLRHTWYLLLQMKCFLACGHCDIFFRHYHYYIIFYLSFISQIYGDLIHGKLTQTIICLLFILLVLASWNEEKSRLKPEKFEEFNLWKWNYFFNLED